MNGMCYPNSASSPLPPSMGGSTDEGDVVLTAADATRLAAYGARAAQPTGSGIVVMPDVRGLHPFYKDLARRFAQAGVNAIAIDYFGRTAGIGDRSDDFDFMTHIKQTTPDGIAADVAAGIAYLRSPAGGGAGSVFTVGFCFGGSLSWRQSAAQPGLAGAIGFYGRPANARDAIPQMRAPLLLLIAGDDRATPRDDFEKFDLDLTRASVPHRMAVYEGAPHSFFDRGFEQHRAASDDAWRQMLDFIKEHTRQPARA
jgi:carboxymethylenebutenolidase